MKKMIVIMLLLLCSVMNAEVIVNEKFSANMGEFFLVSNNGLINTQIALESGYIGIYAGPGKRGGIGEIDASLERRFTLSSSVKLLVCFNYRLMFSGKAENSEFANIRFTFNGVNYGLNSNSYIVQFTGDGNFPSDHMDSTSLSTCFIVDGVIGENIMKLSLYCNELTAKDEWARAAFDNVSVTTQAFKDLRGKEIKLDMRTDNTALLHEYYWIDEGEQVSLNIYIKDPNGQNLGSSDVIMFKNIEGADFSNGLFSWTPTGNQQGYHIFKFVAKGIDNFLYEEVHVIVANNIFNLPVNQLYEEYYSAVDADGDPWVISSVNLPSGAALIDSQVNGQGVKKFTWKPTVDQIGLNTFDITVTDSPAVGTPKSDTRIFKVTVE